MTALPPYDPWSRCAKCGYNPRAGSKQASTHYYSGSGGGGEYLSRRCPRCSFTWKEAVKDSGEQPQPKKSGPPKPWKGS